MSGIVHIFAGPSLPPSAQPRLDSFRYHGPVSQGDVYSLVASRPLAIGIIDGYFERVPAVWHKEILWALSEGVHVFGASSMGALRAAELSDFGMVGVGEIFQDFATGRLQDDDEVTIVHAEAGEDFRAGSEAMVNLRASLALARQEGMLSPSATLEFTDYAKSLFYPDRDYGRLLALAKERLSAPDALAFRAWLKVKSHRVDVKRRDAQQLLGTLKEFQESRPPSKQVPWSFHHTDAWEQVRNAASRRAVETPEVDERSDALVLHRLQATPELQRSLQQEASLRALRARAAKRDGYVVSESDKVEALRDLVWQQGISDGGRLESWLQQQHMTEAEFERLVCDEVCARHSARMMASNAGPDLLDLLRLSGRYGELSRDEAEATSTLPKAAE